MGQYLGCLARGETTNEGSSAPDLTVKPGAEGPPGLRRHRQHPQCVGAQQGILDSIRLFVEHVRAPTREPIEVPAHESTPEDQ